MKANPKQTSSPLCHGMNFPLVSRVRTMKNPNKMLLVRILSVGLGLISALGCQPRQSSTSDAPQAAGQAPVILGTPATAARPGEGDWSSGGGYASNNQFNPWFLPNTKLIRYCIEIDEKNFGLDLATAKKSLAVAFEYWKKEFELSRLALKIPTEGASIPVEPEIDLGTQEVREEPCGVKTDIRIQLGFLTEDQLKNIVKPENYLALTVRTEYNPVKLKGKGFIYFSPVRGALKPNSHDLGENRWSIEDAQNFQVMAVHELGHIFGQTTSHHPFMVPNVMNYMVTMAKPGESSEKIPKIKIMNFLKSAPYPFEVREMCAAQDSIINLPFVGRATCLRIKVQSNYNNGAPNYRVLIEYKVDGDFQPYGILSQTYASTSVAHYGKVYVDEQQKVISTKVKRGFLETQSYIEHEEIEGKLTISTKLDRLPEALIRTLNDNNGTLSATMYIEGQGGRIMFTVHSWKDIKEYADHRWYLRFDSAGDSLYKGFEPPIDALK